MKIGNSFADAKVGDVFAVDANLGGWRKVRCIRVTPTQIITEHGQRWRNSDGALLGASAWHRQRLEILTPEIERRIAVQNARSFMARDWRTCSDDQILAVAKAAKAALETE